MEKQTVLLIDLSALFFPAYHVSKDEPGSVAFRATIDGVKRCQKMVPDSRVAICCDGRGNWRKELSPAYKAQRETQPAALYGLLDKVKQALRDDGYLLWQVDGFEADDLIFTATQTAKDLGHPVVIASHDKDLLALVDDAQEVSALRTATWNIVHEKEVCEKFDIAHPCMITDWLSLTGDSSDGVVGVPGVGPKTASLLLGKFGDLESLMRQVALSNCDETDRAIYTPKVVVSLKASIEVCVLAKQLVTMKFTDKIVFDEIFQEREHAAAIKGMPNMDEFDDVDDDSEPTKKSETTDIEDAISSGPGPSEAEQKVKEVFVDAKTIKESTPVREKTDYIDIGMPSQTAEKKETALTITRGEFQLGLQPSSMKAAFILAEALYDSKLYPKLATPQAIFAILARGRECGLGALASLGSFHFVEGTVTASANLLIAMAQNDPMCEYFYMTECSERHATWETKHKRNPGPTRYTYTIEMAMQAGLLEKEKSNWRRRPQDMCVKTAGGKLARIVYPGSMLDLYSPEEMGHE